MDFLSGKETIISRLQRLAEEDPDKTAFVFWDKNFKRTAISRRDVWDRSRKCAAFFHRRGIRKGDVVCNTLANSQERLITMYGTILAGAVSMQGQKLLADGEDIILSWTDSQCKAVIIDPHEEKGVGGVLERLKHTDKETGKVGYDGLPNLHHVIHIALGNDNKNSEEEEGASTSWLQCLDQEQEMYVDDTVTADDVAFIMTTSGSTGFAKLIPHTHHRFLIIASYIRTLFSVTPDSSMFNLSPLGWMGGCPVLYPAVGFTKVLLDMSYGLAKDQGSLISHILEREKCDAALLLPSAVQMVLDHLDRAGKDKLSTQLRVIGTGGGPVSSATMKALGRLCVYMVVIYGASEFGLTHGLKVTDPSDYENTCIGSQVDAAFFETKIVDDNLREVAPGASGEMLVKGPTITTGYLNKPEVNKEVFLADGWFRTSDIGHVNEKGQLFAYCRKSFAINHKGYIHYPGWFEARIDKHPNIKKSAVIGIPHPTVHENICVCLTTTSGSTLRAEEVRDYCKSLFLTGEEAVTPTPKYYLFFESFPLNKNGKLDKKAVREMAIKRVEVEYGTANA